MTRTRTRARRRRRSPSGLCRPLRPLWDYWRDSLLLTLHILLSPAVFLWRLLKKLLLPFKKCFLFYLI